MIVKNLLFAKGFAVPVLSEIFIWIESAIYNAAIAILNAFFELINFSSNIGFYSITLESIIKRVTVLAGVYALFKLGVMLITYLVDPSKLKNAESNGINIIKGIIIAVVLLVTSSLIFDTLNEFQSLILNGNENVQPLIPRLIYGPDEASNSENDIKITSKKLVNNMWLLFFTEKRGKECANSYDLRCKIYNGVQSGSENYSIGDLADYYKDFTYTPVIPLIVGIALVYFFVTFTIELATRLFKLLVLQIISPIPIIMYIDPSQRKRLTNFLKLYGSLYLQVFFRVLSFYLAFVVVYLTTKDITIETSGVGVYLKLILILGIFAAVKELPKLLEEALGLKISGITSTSKFGKSLLAGVIGGGIGLVGGTAAGAISGGVGGALAGGASGLVGGATSMFGARNAADGIKKAVGNIGTQYKKGANIRGAGGLGNYMVGGFQNFFGGQNRDKATITKFDNDIKQQDDLIKGYQKKIDGYNDTIATNNDFIQNANQANNLRDRVQNTMDENFTRLHGTFDEYLEKDPEYLNYRKTQHDNQENGLWGYADRDNANLENRKHELELQYNQLKENYYNDALDTSFVGPRSADKEEISKALNDYNDFVRENGMENRVITSYSGGDTDLESSKANLEADIRERQEIIKTNRADIEKEKKNIAEKEARKKEIEESKKKFEESPEYIRRNKRDEKPQGHARNTDRYN